MRIALSVKRFFAKRQTQTAYLKPQYHEYRKYELNAKSLASKK